MYLELVLIWLIAIHIFDMAHTHTLSYQSMSSANLIYAYLLEIGSDLYLSIKRVKDERLSCTEYGTPIVMNRLGLDLSTICMAHQYSTCVYLSTIWVLLKNCQLNIIWSKRHTHNRHPSTCVFEHTRDSNYRVSSNI